jgi:L-lactate dehydrogenase complex protein LldG
LGGKEENGVSARDAILARIRNSLAVETTDAGRRAMVTARLESTPRGVIPARSNLPPTEQLALFRTMAEGVSASVDQVGDRAAVPKAVANYLRVHNLPMAFRMGEDARLAALPWEAVPKVEIARGASDGGDAVCVSHAFAGVAETGTVVLLSGADNPTTLKFLPEAHIVIIHANDIVGDYESVWDRLRAETGKGKMPRTVNLISGQSRSADIEQALLLGAHGPRRLHIIIVGSETPPP